MSAHLHISDRLYSLIATELYYEIEGREYVTFGERSGFETDTNETYTTLTGTMRMSWNRFPDEAGNTVLELRDVWFSPDTVLHTVHCDEQATNDFQSKRLREYLID